MARSGRPRGRGRERSRRSGWTGRLVLFVVLLSFAVPAWPGLAQAQSGDAPSPDGAARQLLEAQIDDVDTYDLERFLQQLDDDVRSALPEFNLRRLVLDPEGGLRFRLSDSLHLVARLFAEEVVVGTKLLVQLVAVAVLAALLHNLASAFGNKGVHDIAFLVALVTVLFLGIQAFRTALGLAAETVQNMSDLMYVLLPILATMLASVGGVTSAAIFHPMLIALVTGVATLVVKVILPLILVGVVFAVGGKIVSDFPVDRLAGLARQWATAVLGLCFIVFLGFLSIRGAIAPVADGLGVKAAKFLTGTFVPVIGGRLADAMDVVIGGSLLIKNAIGAFGMLTIFTLTVIPAVKLFTLLLIFRVAAALAEPVSESRLVGALSSLGDGMAFTLACVLTVALMFFIGITVLVALGNFTVVMRG